MVRDAGARGPGVPPAGLVRHLPRGTGAARRGPRGGLDADGADRGGAGVRGGDAGDAGAVAEATARGAHDAGDVARGAADATVAGGGRQGLPPPAGLTGRAGGAVGAVHPAAAREGVGEERERDETNELLRRHGGPPPAIRLAGVRNVLA